MVGVYFNAPNKIKVFLYGICFHVDDGKMLRTVNLHKLTQFLLQFLVTIGQWEQIRTQYS